MQPCSLIEKIPNPLTADDVPDSTTRLWQLRGCYIENCWIAVSVRVRRRGVLDGGRKKCIFWVAIDRCLWGTDWTRAFAVVNYEQAVEPFLKTGRLSETERAMLMGGACAKAGGACAKAYGWSPRKS
jgi:hypothetical protein